MIHTVGTDLSLTPAEAIASDDPNEYSYTVSLMDEEHKFEGSYMEVKAKTLRCVATPLSMRSVLTTLAIAVID